jgi:hypothetical protein
MASENVGGIDKFPNQHIADFRFQVFTPPNFDVYGPGPGPLNGFCARAMIQTNISSIVMTMKTISPLQIIRTGTPEDRDYKIKGKTQSIYLYGGNKQSNPYIRFGYASDCFIGSSQSAFETSIPWELYNRLAAFFDANLTITGPVKFLWGGLPLDDPKPLAINVEEPHGGGKRKTQRRKRKPIKHQ